MENQESGRSGADTASPAMPDPTVDSTTDPTVDSTIDPTVSSTGDPTFEPTVDEPVNNNNAGATVAEQPSVPTISEEPTAEQENDVATNDTPTTDTPTTDTPTAGSPDAEHFEHIGEYTDERIEEIIQDYFPPAVEDSSELAEFTEDKELKAINTNTTWNSESVFGEEMSAIYDPSSGIIPEALPPLRQRMHNINLPAKERYYLAQKFPTLLKFAGTITKTQPMLHTFNALRLKSKIPRGHPSGFPETIGQENIPLLNKILEKLEEDQDSVRNTYRLEMLVHVIRHYEGENKDLFLSNELDMSYHVEKYLQTVVQPSVRCNTPDEFAMRQFAALLELQEWNDRIGTDTYGEPYYDMIGISKKKIPRVKSRASSEDGENADDEDDSDGLEYEELEDTSDPDTQQEAETDTEVNEQPEIKPTDPTETETKPTQQPDETETEPTQASEPQAETIQASEPQTETIQATEPESGGETTEPVELQTGQQSEPAETADHQADSDSE